RRIAFGQDRFSRSPHRCGDRGRQAFHERSPEMRKRIVQVLLCAAAVGGGVARAADHRDGPGVQADPSTDINDVYAWMNSDASKVNLVMTVSPGASTSSKFSDAALYVFHVNALKMFGDSAPNRNLVICKFTTAQKISCWGPGDEYLTGDASATAGLA